MKKRGRATFPSFLSVMEKELIIEKVEKVLAAFLAANPGHFLVDIKIKPTNNIKVFLDGDNGIGIDDLVKYNRSVYHQLEEDGFFPDGDFSLEISSAGLDEPLKIHRQYIKNIGREVEVLKNDGTAFTGKLLSVEDGHITVEEIKGKGKKAETLQHTVALDDIKATKVQPKF